jgi:hypothetical protein
MPSRASSYLVAANSWPLGDSVRRLPHFARPQAHHHQVESGRGKPRAPPASCGHERGVPSYVATLGRLPLFLWSSHGTRPPRPSTVSPTRCPVAPEPRCTVTYGAGYARSQPPLDPSTAFIRDPLGLCRWRPSEARFHLQKRKKRKNSAARFLWQSRRPSPFDSFHAYGS